MEEKEFNELVAKLEKAAGKKIDDQFKEALKELDLESLKALKPEDLASKKDIDKLTKLVEETSEKANQAIEGSGRFNLQTIEQKVHAFIEKNFDKIKAIKSQGHGFIEFEIKAVGSMTTGSVANPDGIPDLVGVQVAPPTRVNLRASIIDGLVTRINTSLAAYPYTESVPKDGDYAFVAEGTAKSQIDFKIETRYAQPVKVAAWEHLTDESVQDIPGLQSIATGFLKDKHDLKRQRGILFGSGVSPEPKGATLYGRTFVAGGMALAVVNPNFMDVVNAGITDIYTTHNFQDEMPYQPSLVMVSPVDFYIDLVSAKTSFGEPLYPTASLFNRVDIGGVTIVPFQDIPLGKVFIADMNKYNITDYISYTVKIGFINDDFIKNQFVMLGESRFHAFVKKLDQQAFIYDNIATIKTAITKP